MLRELSVQATIEGSARARLLRSSHTKSTVSAAKLNLQLGELVDFYRQPSTKDVSGWYGPAKIVDLDNQTRGIVTVKYLRNVYEVAIRHLRKHLTYWVFHAATDRRTHPTYHNVWAELGTMVSDLPARVTHHVGAEKTTRAWINVTYNVRGPWKSRLLCAARFYGQNMLQLPRIVSVRVAHGVAVLPSVRGYHMAVTMLWLPRDYQPKFVYQDANNNGVISSLNIRELTHEWPHYRCIRFHL